MRLRIEGDLKNYRVVNDDTGEELEGVDRIDWDTFLNGKCTLTLTHAAIDVSIDASRVEAITHEDGTYARTKLLEIAGLRWRK